MLPPKITNSTPDETHQMDLIPDPTEEEYPEFEGMCGWSMVEECMGSGGYAPLSNHCVFAHFDWSHTFS